MNSTMQYIFEIHQMSLMQPEIIQCSSECNMETEIHSLQPAFDCTKQLEVMKRLPIEVKSSKAKLVQWIINNCLTAYKVYIDSFCINYVHIYNQDSRITLHTHKLQYVETNKT